MQVKIYSNPYEKTIRYEKRKSSDDNWETITHGELVDNFSKGVFPFIVEHVLDTIISLYTNDGEGKIEIIFQGADDEYKELINAIDNVSNDGMDYSERITAHKSDKYLENAREILPEINRIFGQSIKPSISDDLLEHPMIKRNIDKFVDVSSDIIPICVVGNYSSGKSTFINALLGIELLPSADRPTTAKYFKISNSHKEDFGSISYEYDNGNKVTISFNSKGVVLSDDRDNLSRAIQQLMESDDNNLIIRMRNSIDKINEFDNNQYQYLPDLISIKAPFGKGVLNSSCLEYMIIDTPGSNSATKWQHSKALNDALEGFTNGLPVYVSTYDALDTKDNKDLIEDITHRKELDSRFAMLVVNQADTARIPRDGFSKNDIDDIINDAVPKNLGTERMFFVSSIMGLGAKNGENFYDDGYAETFIDSKAKFTSPESKYYKQLFKYNIVPLRLKTLETNELYQNNDTLMVNSGLYSVENEIGEFAEKYSKYNKCVQSKAFLGNALDITQQQIDLKKDKCFEEKEKLKNSLEEEKKDLLNKILDTSEELQKEYHLHDRDDIEIFEKEIQTKLKGIDLHAIEDGFQANNEKLNDVDGKKDRLDAAIGAIGDNIAGNFRDIFVNRNFSKIKDVGTDFFKDVANAADEIGHVNDAKRRVEKETALDLVKHMDKLFKDASNEIQDKIYEDSKLYWENKCEDIKDKFAKIVHESDSLTEEERKSLTSTIIDFEKLSIIELPDIIFFKSDFDFSIRMNNWKIIFYDGIMINKLSSSFTRKLLANTTMIKERIVEDHESKFDHWLETLINEIEACIVEKNPNLRKMNSEIRRLAVEIDGYEKTKRDLNHYKSVIEQMMLLKG